MWPQRQPHPVQACAGLAHPLDHTARGQRLNISALYSKLHREFLASISVQRAFRRRSTGLHLSIGWLQARVHAAHARPGTHNVRVVGQGNGCGRVHHPTPRGRCFGFARTPLRVQLCHNPSLPFIGRHAAGLCVAATQYQRGGPRRFPCSMGSAASTNRARTPWRGVMGAAPSSAWKGPSKVKARFTAKAADRDKEDRRSAAAEAAADATRQAQAALLALRAVAAGDVHALSLVLAALTPDQVAELEIDDVRAQPLASCSHVAARRGEGSGEM